MKQRVCDHSPLYTDTAERLQLQRHVARLSPSSLQVSTTPYDEACPDCLDSIFVEIGRAEDGTVPSDLFSRGL